MALETSSAAKRWTNRALVSLMWPLVIEQLLGVSIGLVDTLMVSSVGQSAVSGVSLVDGINILLLTAFSALATGGSVVCSQYLGRREPANASRAAKNLVYAIALVAAVIMSASLLLHRPLLRLIYGHIEPAVMQNAQTYFWMSALTYPFIALYNAGAAIFRSMGNSRVGMVVAIIINLLNIGGNSLFIFGLNMGVAGAALSTLISRIVAAVVLLLLLFRAGTGPISLRGFFKTRPDKQIIKEILRIGVPNGLESSVFQIGKLIVARVVSSFGTAAIAGNAIAQTVCSIASLPGQAFGFALLTVVGQCMGAKDPAAAKRNTTKLMAGGWVSMLVLCTVLVIFDMRILALFKLEADAAQLASKCIFIFSIMAPVFWPISFTLPNALRAAGDAKYTMVVSLISMWSCRVALSYVFAHGLGMGTYGVWYAMTIDWVVRSACFGWRWLRGKWQQKQVIAE